MGVMNFQIQTRKVNLTATHILTFAHSSAHISLITSHFEVILLSTESRLIELSIMVSWVLYDKIIKSVCIFESCLEKALQA